MLENKVAIITGGSQGFGKAVASRFLKSGASVVICGRDSVALDQAKKDLEEMDKFNILTVRADISKEEEAKQVVQTCLNKFKRVDILVNNAGVHGAKGEIDQVDLEEWKKAIEVNLYGTVHMIRAALPYMKKQMGGKIINLSGGGATSPRPYFSAYAVSKAAIVRLTENFAIELQKYRIEINAIAPGAMNTRLLEDILNSGEKLIGQEYNSALKQKENGGVSTEVGAKLCEYLASEMSNGITGRLISAVWDDWEYLGEHLEELRTSDIYTLRRITPKERGKSWGDK